MSTHSSLIGKYELQERLGQRGHTEVWKAFDTQENRYAALKFLNANLQTDPEFVLRFQREAPAVVSLRHPNIVQYYDFAFLQVPDSLSVSAYLAMEFIDGGTLADYIDKSSRGAKSLDTPDIVRLFTPICMAVEYAHQHAIVHGNLKPANILLDKRNTSRNAIGEPLVADFGLARLIGTGAGSVSDWLNTSPLYISPEQIMGSRADARSDIYSLGIMLYELCAGVLPFPGNNLAAIMMQHVHTVPASPSLINPHLPPALAEIIMRCIAKDPAERFPSASSLVEALANVTGSEAVSIAAPETGEHNPADANSMNMPTMISTKVSPLPTGGATPPAAVYSSNAPLAALSQPHPVARFGGSTTPIVPTQATAHSPRWNTTQPPTAPASKNRGKRGLWIALSAVLILVLLGSALGARFVFAPKGSTATTPHLVGHAYFVSSGLISPDSTEGITDQLQIRVDTVSPPQAGKSYYAWLLNDRTMNWRPILLGALTFKNNTLAMFYQGDRSHSNLLANNSRFLITEEDAAVPPTSPSLDPSTWLYYAEFSQRVPSSTNPMSTPASSMSTPTDSMSTPASSMSTPTNPMATPGSAMSMSSFSLYDHLRHLLAAAPALQAVGLTGGLDTWLYRNTQKILEWAGSSRDFWKYKSTGSSAFIHRQLTRIMDYLDGANFVQKDLPSQQLIVPHPNYAKVGLLTFDPQTQDPTGFLYEMGQHLHEISLLPETSAEQKVLAIQINQAIDQVNIWDQRMREDIMKLYPMTDAHLFGAEGRTLLDDIATLANEAFAGTVNLNAQVAPGVVQIHYDIQRLATFDLRACTASDPCALS